MNRTIASGLLRLVLPAIAVVACSESPVGPNAGSDRADGPVPFAQPATGEYDLEFLWSGTALTIVAHVRAAGGAAPGGGTVVFQYCSLGQPTDDIDQPDEASISACADHSGHWVTLARRTLNPAGDASLSFGSVTVVTVIGFRLRYTGQGSGVENATIEEDWFRPL